MIYAIYLIIVFAALLPIIFRRVYWLRLVCALLLGVLASLHLTFLLTEHRLVLERGIQHFEASSTKPLPGDFQTAVGMIQDLNQGETIFVFLLIIAFATLALLPFGLSVKREDSSAQQVAGAKPVATSNNVPITQSTK
jgi:hypothetical protein